MKDSNKYDFLSNKRLRDSEEKEKEKEKNIEVYIHKIYAIGFII